LPKSPLWHFSLPSFVCVCVCVYIYIYIYIYIYVYIPNCVFDLIVEFQSATFPYHFFYYWINDLLYFLRVSSLNILGNDTKPVLDVVNPQHKWVFWVLIHISAFFTISNADVQDALSFFISVLFGSCTFCTFSKYTCAFGLHVCHHCGLLH